MSYVLAILESSWGKLLYHSTSEDFDPKKIKQGSHLGSLSASLTRARELSSNDSERKSYKVHAYNYKPSGRSVEVEDEWSDNPHTHSIAGQLNKKGTISNEEHKALYKPVDRQQWPGQKKPYVGISDKDLGGLLKSKGISSVRYKALEDPTDYTHIVFDHENLHHVHTFNDPKSLKRGMY